ncbi:hypothetical protein [Actinoplanes sp. NPDC049599]|uniref:hypothetical protein n=1 Tax=Actinoplanes sp. NPDC049599 TaxID=3363903 RepID=UPI0037A0FD3C
MALEFAFVIHVRHQFGDDDQDIGVFAGREQTFAFDCPLAGPDHALLLFQSLGVSREQTLEVNGVTVFGGVPVTDAVFGVTGLPLGGASNHTHPVQLTSAGWVGNVLIINPGVLRDRGNALRIASGGDEFVVDNAVVLYRTRSVGAGGGVFTEQERPVLPTP